MFNLNICMYNSLQPKTPNGGTLQQKLDIMKSAIINIVHSNYNINLSELSGFYSNKIYKLHGQMEKTTQQLKIDIKKKPLITISLIDKNIPNSTNKKSLMPNNFYGLYV